MSLPLSPATEVFIVALFAFLASYEEEAL